MKRRGIPYLYVSVAFVFIIGLTCGCEATPTIPAMQPTQTQTQTPAATATATITATTTATPTVTATATLTPEGGSNQQFKIFIDMNKVYSAEVPSDWLASSIWLRALSVPNSHLPPNTLTFTWKSPDQHGAVVFLEYDVQQKVAASQMGDKAKLLLDWFFSKDGYSTQIGIAEDIVDISDNNPLPDGTIHLSWGLVNTKMAGTSYVYQRGSALIVLSTFCDETYADAFANIFAHITNSYKVP